MDAFGNRNLNFVIRVHFPPPAAKKEAAGWIPRHLRRGRPFPWAILGGGAGVVFRFALLRKALSRVAASLVAASLVAASLLLPPLVVGVLGAGLLEGQALAHGPRQHSVKLVEFKPPVPAPDFTLENLEGESVRLADFRGKFVLLNFWATWCPPCVREMPSMQRLGKRFKDRPFVVLGISLDTSKDAPKVKAFIKRLKLTFPMSLDPNSRISEKYGARDLPATFLIDPLGRVILAAKGERDWYSKEIVGYLEEVVAATTSGN